MLSRCLLVFVLFGGVPAQAFATLLSFGSPIPGTIADSAGNGTGFTHRLPGTGGSLPTPDSNLDITASPGTLRFRSTQGDPNNGGVNLGAIEAPGLLLTGVTGKDIVLRALVTNVNVPNPNDQFTLYAGSSVSEFIRGGVHELETYPIATNQGGFDTLVFDAGHQSFDAGDDILLTLQRIGGFWSLAWQNLTNPGASGASPGLSFPWLDDDDSLYVGLLAANAGSKISQTYQVQFFEATVVPEPISSVLLCAGLSVVGCYSLLRQRLVSRRSPSCK